jgi:hypothetical protein
MLQINDARETYREQVQSTGADGIDPNNIGLQMAKLHELEGRLLEERGDKAELLSEKEALLERLQRLNGMDKENLAEKEELQAALIRSEEDRLEIARALVEVQVMISQLQIRLPVCPYKTDTFFFPNSSSPTKRSSRRRKPGTTWWSACTSWKRGRSRARCG